MGNRRFRANRNLMNVATDRRILTLIVRARMSIRRQRRDNGFFVRLAHPRSQGRQGSTVEEQLSAMLPPRCDWPRPGKLQRVRGEESGQDPLVSNLVDWLIRGFGTPRSASPAWLVRLRRFVGTVRQRIHDWDDQSLFQSPKVHVQLKGLAGGKRKADEYRCLTEYSLDDRIVISIAARYLRELTDAAMHPGSIAFRTSSPPLTHHDAVNRILDFLQRHSGKPLWIAEVDIRGFFDVVSHDVALESVDALLRRVPNPRSVDPRARLMLGAYLRSYSFNGTGRDQAHQAAQARKRPGVDVAVPWPEEALRALGVSTETSQVGVPQGGALSCFLANEFLDDADRAVQLAIDMSTEGSQAALYLRYCDDIVCIASSRDVCESMLDAYTGALRTLKLPAHACEPFSRRYGSQPESEKKDGGFWHAKSKGPYAWAASGPSGHVPWCSFVGYQIRHDGTLRLRPSSVKKEIVKQHQVVVEVLRIITRSRQAKSKRQVLYRVRQRMRSMTVGNGRIGQGPHPPPFSWTQGFRLLGQHRALTGQLRELDRHRTRAIRFLGRRLDPDVRGSRSTEEAGLLAFEGFPYSYAGLGERGARRIESGRRS